MTGAGRMHGRLSYIVGDFLMYAAQALIGMSLLWLGRLFPLVGYPSLVAIPFGPEWLRLAKGVAAGEFSDELLRSFTLHDRC